MAFAPPASVALFASGMNLAAPIVCDPEREAYRAFGFGRRGGWSALVHPVYWWRLLRALRRGRRLRLPREDPHQLGGDAVLDAELRLRWIHRSRYPADRPPVRRVLHEVRKAAALSALG